jgi:NDP-sugar pyrophosphorylase family protein
MISSADFIAQLTAYFPSCTKLTPWEITQHSDEIIQGLFQTLDADYTIENKLAIHKSAVIEPGVILKGTIIIGENSFVGANAYLRGPIFLGKSVKIGPSSEIKQSFIFDNSSVAHFNYVGNSILGQHVNLEAGAICANHFNERTDKNIVVIYLDQHIATHTEKFGALIGYFTKIGANAVLSPGTILPQNSIVKRLELVEQVKS